VIHFNDSSDHSQSSSRKFLKWITGICAVAAVVALGTTLASNISLNNNGPIEFGQGITQTLACSGNEQITLTPLETFANGNPGTFLFSGINFSGPEDILANCAGRTIQFNLYGSSGGSLQTFSITDGGLGVGYMSTDGNITYLSATSLNFALTSPVVDATSVYKITLESSDTGGPLGYGLAFFRNQVFVSNATGIGFTVGESIASQSFPSGLTIISISPHQLSESDPDGIGGTPLQCAATNSYSTGYSVENCQGFHFGELGYLITLSANAYVAAAVEHLYPTPP